MADEPAPRASTWKTGLLVILIIVGVIGLAILAIYLSCGTVKKLEKDRQSTSRVTTSFCV